jgi:outer membrane immunogenic protein
MRLPLFIASASVLIAATTLTTHAADPVFEAPVLPQTPEVQLDTSQWGGFYLGAYGKYNWFSPGISGSGKVDDESFGGGLYTGYNWDIGNNIVTGLELNAGIVDSGANVAGTFIDQQWDASLRARLGYAFENSLLYSFAGLAVTSVEAAALTGTDENTLTGFTVGAGLETEIFEGVTARIEYGYDDYSDENFALGAANPNVEVNNQGLNLGFGFKF